MGADAQLAAGVAPGVLGAGPGVVGQDPFHGDAAFGEPGGGAGQEGRAGVGLNFIDPADVYSHGTSEEIAGQAIKGSRDDLVHGHQVPPPEGGDPNQRGNSRRWIMRAVEDSLRGWEAATSTSTRCTGIEGASRAWVKATAANCSRTSGAVSVGGPGGGLSCGFGVEDAPGGAAGVGPSGQGGQCPALCMDRHRPAAPSAPTPPHRIPLTAGTHDGAPTGRGRRPGCHVQRNPPREAVGP
jgi:hypothetical protein